ncbi:MAG: bifunctional oligoribonuclease/PAP phosphatase NrnA [Treponema sp.]|nr:bifunctional oligoribonuclease/PAP phosphatase NrnA [Treponema sp.]
MIVVPPELCDFIYKGNKFLVVGHEEPDGDCAGSQLALVSALRRLGKEAVAYSDGPFKRTELTEYKDRFSPFPLELDGTNVIMVDCSSLRRIGQKAVLLAPLPLAIIDHHITVTLNASTASAPVFLDSSAPAATVMILAVIEALGLQLTVDEAELLFLGLCTDTGFFRHLDIGSERHFEAAARMVKAGASPKRIFQRIYEGKTLKSRLLVAKILSRCKSYFGGKLIIGTEKYKDRIVFGFESRDSDTLYQLTQSIKGVEVTVLIRQDTPETCTLGFRSLNEIDVAAVAAVHFGGGGHKNAAGASVKGCIEQVLPQVISIFEPIFTQ